MEKEVLIPFIAVIVFASVWIGEWYNDHRK